MNPASAVQGQPAGHPNWMKQDNPLKAAQSLGTRLRGGFQYFARATIYRSGHPAAFGLAVTLVALWALTGPWFDYGTTWLLVINTVGTLITFLIIFLIRNAQNRESEAMQLKLDELIRATRSAHNSLLDIEELSEADLNRIKARFARLAHQARTEPGGGPIEIVRTAQIPGAPAAAVLTSDVRL